MPNKYPEKKEWKVPKQKFKVTNWSEYNKALRRRGDITVWGSLQEGTKFPAAPLQPFTSLGCSQ